MHLENLRMERPSCKVPVARHVYGGKWGGFRGDKIMQNRAAQVLSRRVHFSPLPPIIFIMRRAAANSHKRLLRRVEAPLLFPGVPDRGEKEVGGGGACFV